MAKVMFNAKKLPKRLQVEAINIACHISNRVFLRKGTNQTPYELWKGKKPDLSFFHVYGCKCYVLNDREKLGKFDARSDKEVYLGYSSNSRAFKIYNMRTERIIQSFNVVFIDVEDFLEYSQEGEIGEISAPTIGHHLADEVVSGSSLHNNGIELTVDLTKEIAQRNISRRKDPNESQRTPNKLLRMIAGWMSCMKSLSNLKGMMCGLLCQCQKESTSSEPNGFSRTKPMNLVML
ncbi:uncharacterized protein LOC116106699 [Pistacia vera]|uniref:uncharacterized protein LOC116106699 n=1 Tax=Pistacia vera TaxID=55513 RepID=UPI0012637992|nr:uncharacterized protein LOC116106699 [Pistacia vera]